jgi:hypothetical protein
LNPNRATVAVNNPLDNRQTYASTFKFSLGVQPLKGSKQPIGIFHRKTYSVILDKNSSVR